MTAPWKVLEWLPKKAKWREWKERRTFCGWYLPRSEPRLIPDGATIHWTVLERQSKVSDYRPVNLPMNYTVTDAPGTHA